MTLRTSILTAAIIASAQIAMCQQTIWQKLHTSSPQVMADGRVSFQLRAPQASRVELIGDFLSQHRIHTPLPPPP